MFVDNLNRDERLAALIEQYADLREDIRQGDSQDIEEMIRLEYDLSMLEFGDFGENCQSPDGK